MIVIGGVVGSAFDCLLELIHRGAVGALKVVSPAERVGGVGEVGQALSRDLGVGDGGVDVASVLEEEIGKIVGGVGVIGLNLEGLLIEIFGLLPLAARFEQASERDGKANVARIALQGALIFADGLIDRAA